MLSIDWGKLDKFYLVLTLVLILMSVLVIMSVRAVFSAYITAYEIDQSALESGLKINKGNLDEAYDWVFNRQGTPLINDILPALKGGYPLKRMTYKSSIHPWAKSPWFS